jgi:transketolase
MLKLAESLAEHLDDCRSRDPDLWLLDGDLGDSYGLSEDLIRSFGPRFVQAGIAEQSMVSVAAGLAGLGKHPWVFSFAAFLCSRAHDQIRCGVSQMRLPVTLVGANAGIDGLKNGNTHVSLIDLSLMSSLPDIDIWSPASEVELGYAVDIIMRDARPAYLRLARFGAEGSNRVRHELLELRDGTDILILSTGIASSWALDLAASLQNGAISVRVVQVIRIKPLPESLEHIIHQGYSGIYTLEDHSSSGGFGDLVAHAYPELHVRRLGWPQTWLPAELQTANLRGRHGLDTAGLTHRILQDLSTASSPA